MKFEEIFDFGHEPATVMRMFCDKDYYLEKYRRMGAHAPELIEVESDDKRFSITVRHSLDATKMKFPDLVKKRIGDRLILRQTDTWRPDAHDGRIDIEIEKTPVTIAVDMQLVAASGGARLDLAFDIEASIPLLGGKIEKAVAGPITRYMHNDLALSDEMAADYTA